MEERLKEKWRTLKFWELCLQDNVVDKHTAKITIANIKRAIRKANKQTKTTKIIYSDTNGYFVELIQLPKFVTNLAEAEWYFKEELFLSRFYSLYDCTGHYFTVGHKCIQRGNNFYVYHEIGQNC